MMKKSMILSAALLVTSGFTAAAQDSSPKSFDELLDAMNAERDAKAQTGTPDMPDIPTPPGGQHLS